ncbi:2',3'-cyclic-nucleotide 2'-phosphodiesterase (5'-nucleotidase family) [Hydrogenispora ethanolica]|uniref:2',3'-cyclic-nucleotide 2'-phosphodiesterase (5'-nucleotidase family) n=1 Tax=Hydrogenispora ethanolica TaxID=1082276 RepID=A0A4R1RJR4_HYDET|nr:5'-nucleotidase C-terminal domain-containing protein [Hydrogenispora ethanolica]TCL65932.1 2',3'-cyclic-nucleotide 2'-phosphodiesterase (5'-nucleotidase family) [Hydrogenispora ethanolica]
MLRMKKAWLLLLSLVMLFGLLGIHAAQAENSVRITILGTSDLHGRLFPWDYAIDSEEPGSGLVKVATVVKAVRAENPNTIVVDNGDTIQDNMAELFNDEPVHPMIQALNAIGYDTWTPGNHEFNFGLDVLNRCIKGSKATVVAANLYRADGKRYVKPYKIINKGGVRVAIIGMTNPLVPRFEASTPDNFKGLTFTDPVSETKKVIAELKGKADVLIGVMHIGVDPEYGDETSGLKAVLAANPELTAVVCGHAHSDIPGQTINGVLVVEPKVSGNKVSRIDLTVAKVNGKWTVQDKSSTNIDTLAVKADPDLAAKFQWVHDKSLADVNTVIGKVSGAFLPGLEVLPGIPTAQVQDTALMDFINEVQLYYTGADVSAAALFSNSSNLVPGDFKKKDVANIYKYTNTLIAVKVTGKQLKNYMEWSAQYYNQSKPGDVTVSFNPYIRGYNYDLFAGVNYEINIAAPAGRRIENLTFKGKPVTDDMTLTLAVNNYRFGNMVKDKYFNEADKVYDSYEQLGDKGRLRDLIVAYVQKVGTVAPKLDNNWKITGVNFDSPLKAEIYQKVRAGQIKIPASFDGRTPNVKALNVYELCRDGALNYRIVDVLAITDFHGSLARSGKNIGIANLVGELKKLKAANPDSILVSAGDNYQGSAESNLLYGKPVSAGFKEAGIVLSAIGNHEYDWGSQRIPGWAADGGFDFLAANIYDRKTGQPVAYAQPYRIITVAGVKVGFIGLTTPETAWKTNPENVKDVEFRDPVAVLAHYVPVVRAAGADIVVALTHMGGAQDKSGAISGEAADLAKVPGLDGIIAGHSHDMVVGKAGNVPYVMPYYNGRSVGRLSFIVARDQPKVVSAQASLDHLFLRQSTLQEDEATKAILAQYLEQVKPILSEQIGETKVALVHDTKGPSLMGEWACDIMRQLTGAQIGMQNGGGLRVSLDQGVLTVGDLYRLMPFDNTLVTAELTGAQVREAVENGLGNPKVGYFGQVTGLKVTYDLSKPFGQRIVTITLENGQPLDPNKLYTVVANDFMFAGGDNYTSLQKGQHIKDTGIPVRDAMIQYIKERKVISPVYRECQRPAAAAAEAVKPAA